MAVLLLLCSLFWSFLEGPALCWWLSGRSLWSCSLLMVGINALGLASCYLNSTLSMPTKKGT